MLSIEELKQVFKEQEEQATATDKTEAKLQLQRERLALQKATAKSIHKNRVNALEIAQQREYNRHAELLLKYQAQRKQQRINMIMNFALVVIALADVLLTTLFVVAILAI